MRIISFVIILVLSLLVIGCGTTTEPSEEINSNTGSSVEVAVSEPIEESAPAEPVATDTPTPEDTPTPLPPTVIPTTTTTEPTQVPTTVPTQIPTETDDSTTSSPMEIDECSDIPDLTQRSMCEMAEKMGMSMEDMMEMAEEMGMLDDMDTGTDDVMTMDIADMEGMDGNNPCLEVEEEYRSRCEESIRREVKQNTEGENQESDGYYIDGEFDPDNLPKVAKANFAELEKLGRTSKIRSGVGHDYSFNTSEYDPTGASCRSMKHYMIPVGVPTDNALYSTTPHTFDWMSIKFFAPIDGVIKNKILIKNVLTSLLINID